MFSLVGVVLPVNYKQPRKQKMLSGTYPRDTDRLVASWMHSPKARPPEGVFKCSGHKFTSHSRWEHVGISYKLSLKFLSEIAFLLMKQTKTTITSKLEPKITQPKTKRVDKRISESSNIFAVTLQS